MKNIALKRRILEISYKHRLSHLGSCLTAVDIIEEIYQIKKPEEKFVLSSGHAHLAHAVVMEARGIIKDAESNIIEHGIHCERAGGCDVSTGSLGIGLSIAVGMALADRSKNVYCLCSDGEMAEGIIYEAINVINSQQIGNLKVFVNANGYSGYAEVKLPEVDIFTVIKTNSDHLPFLNGLDAHYYIMKEEDYKQANNWLELCHQCQIRYDLGTILKQIEIKE